MDFNNDGILDLVLGERDGYYNFYTGNGDGTLHALPYPEDNIGSPIEREHNSSAYLDDWNEDGYIDFVAGDYNQNTYLFFANDGTGIEGGYSGITVPSAFRLNGNPVAGTLSMNINLGEASSPMFTVYTMNGRTVLSHNAGTLDAGNNNVLIPIDLPSGAYMVRCDTGNIALTERFVVVR